MSLSKTCSIQEDRKLSRHDRKIVGWDVKHQHKQTKALIRLLGCTGGSAPSSLARNKSEFRAKRLKWKLTDIMKRKK